MNNKSNNGFAGALKDYWILLVAAIIFVIFTNYITTTIIIKMERQKIVTFDLKGTTDDFVQKTAMLGKKASADDVKKITEIFNASMQASLNQYESKGYIVMVKPAVVAGASDITAEVQANIYKNIRGEK